MVDNIIFYNHWGAGDIFESREFVREIIRKLPKEKHLYAHSKYPEILKDFKELGFTPLSGEMKQNKSVSWGGNNCYINTWIGRDPKFVLPGTGCVITKHCDMFNGIFKELGIDPLDRPLYSYIPRVNWYAYDLRSVDKFVKEHSNLILICTGIVNSCQSVNFDFAPSVNQLCINHPDFTFITTTEMGFTHPNLFSTQEVITFIPNLNEIAYLSKFCNLIVGRNSGPFVFCQHQENWFNPDKTFLSFTTEKDASTFILSNDLPARKVWCGKTDTKSVIKAIEENLHE